MSGSWLPLILMLTQAPAAPDAILLFDGQSLAHWRVEHVPIGPNERLRINDGPLPEIAGGAVRITSAPGWIRTTSSYAAFRLSLWYRRDANSHGSLYFRTWPRLDASGVPGNGYEVSLGDGPDNRLSGRVIAHGRSGQERFDAGASRAISAAAGTWQRLVLECRGERADVTIDDRPLTVLTAMENPAGYIGLRGENGVLEIRDVVLTPLESKRSSRLEGERPGSGSGVALPALVREVKPAYTAEAMRERIAGAVWLETVVREDGTVGDIEVIRSLDPHFGLDSEAVKALRQWRFSAGSKENKPVPVVVTVELTFTLK